MSDLVNRKTVMKSITEEYNRRRTGDGLKLAWIEKAVNAVPEESGWIPVFEDDRNTLPTVDEDRYSDFVLLSFANAYIPCIGQYREDEDGGAFYNGDDVEPLTRIGLIVNAWQRLPKPYRPEEDYWEGKE